MQSMRLLIDMERGKEIMRQWQEISTWIVGGIIFLSAIKDLKRKEVSLWILGIGGIILSSLFIITANSNWMDRFLGALVGGALLGISKVTKEQIGIGDGLLFCITGIGIGFWHNISLLLYSLMLAAVFSIFMLCYKRTLKNQVIPFVPFVFLAYLGVIFL